MGHPDGAHTHGSGSSGIGSALAALAVAAGVAAVAGPIVAALTDLLTTILIVAAVAVGVTITGLLALIGWRLRHDRVTRLNYQAVVRAIPATPRRDRTAELEARLAAIEAARPAQHIHFHGLDAGDVAAILRHHTRENGPS